MGVRVCLVVKYVRLIINVLNFRENFRKLGIELVINMGMVVRLVIKLVISY